LNNTNYSNTILTAVNLGDDTDTTGCIAGGLGALFYGLDENTIMWQSQLKRSADIVDLSNRFYQSLIVK
jgi:ADP-ribosylglycohydrolase